MITSETIEENNNYEIRHYTGCTEFRGCSCFNDCDCRNNFIKQKVEHYTLTIIKRTSKKTKSKTFYYDTLEQVQTHLNQTK
jgi:hypothetical protein